MPSELDRNAQDPLYLQVVADIKRDITSGLYRAGEKIPSEVELMDIYRVSRITVRRAITYLSEEGYLLKRQGKGTFVEKYDHIEESFFRTDDIVQSFSVTCRNNGVRPGAQLIERGTVPVPHDISSFFGYDSPAEAIRVKRLRTADGVPLMIEDNYFDPVQFGFLLDVPLSNNSIFEVIEKRAGRVPDGEEDCLLSMIRASQEIGDILGVPSGEPLFTVKGRYLDQKGNPLFVGSQYIVGRYYTFRL